MTDFIGAAAADWWYPIGVAVLTALAAWGNHRDGSDRFGTSACLAAGLVLLAVPPTGQLMLGTAVALSTTWWTTTAVVGLWFLCLVSTAGPRAPLPTNSRPVEALPRQANEEPPP